MKSMNQASKFQQLSVITLSAVLFTGTAALGLGALSSLGQANLLKGTELAEQSLAPIKAPIDYEARIAQGDQLFDRRNFGMAAMQYGLAIPIQEENPLAYAKLGKAYLADGNAAKALEALNTATSLDPSNREYTVLKGIALLRNKDYEGAKALLSPIQDHQGALFYTGLIQAQLGDHANAKKSFEAAQKITGSIPAQNINAFLAVYTTFDAQTEGQGIYLNALLIQALLDTGEFTMASDLAVQTLNQESEYRDVWIMLGYAHLKLKEAAQAEDAFKQAAHLDPLKPETHYFLGVAQWDQKKFEDAENSFELALLHNFQPESQAYRKLAESQLALQKYEDALASYEHLNIIDGSTDFILRPIWISINILKDLDRASSFAEDNISKNPNDAQSHAALAWVKLSKGDEVEASTAINTALILDDKSPSAHFVAGLIEESKGNKQSAQSYYNNAYQLAETDDWLRTEAANRYNALATAAS